MLTCLLAATGLFAQDLTTTQALKLGSNNGGIANGKLWFEKGDKTPPFAHAGFIVISRGNQVSLSLNEGQAGNGTGVVVPYDDGSQTRLDFFTSANGLAWITSHVLKPEIQSTRPEKAEDKRPPDHRALAPAAALAVKERDLDFLKILIKRGLKINAALDFEKGDTLLHEATLLGNQEIRKLCNTCWKTMLTRIFGIVMASVRST